MTEQSLSRFFGGGLFNNWCFEDGIFFIIILLLLLCGDELWQIMRMVRLAITLIR